MHKNGHHKDLEKFENNRWIIYSVGWLQPYNTFNTAEADNSILEKLYLI